MLFTTQINENTLDLMDERLGINIEPLIVTTRFNDHPKEVWSRKVDSKNIEDFIETLRDAELVDSKSVRAGPRTDEYVTNSESRKSQPEEEKRTIKEPRSNRFLEEFDDDVRIREDDSDLIPRAREYNRNHSLMDVDSRLKCLETQLGSIVGILEKLEKKLK